MLLVSYCSVLSLCSCLFFFFNDTATTEIYTLSLHDALPIDAAAAAWQDWSRWPWEDRAAVRSEEHTSELQSRGHIVCRLLLEKKKPSVVAETHEVKNIKKDSSDPRQELL